MTRTVPPGKPGAEHSIRPALAAEVGRIMDDGPEGDHENEDVEGRETFDDRDADLVRDQVPSLSGRTCPDEECKYMHRQPGLGRGGGRQVDDGECRSQDRGEQFGVEQMGLDCHGVHVSANHESPPWRAFRL